MDAPGGFAGRRVAHRHVASALDQRPVHAQPFQGAEGLVHRVALADATQVQPHVRCQQLDGPALGIEPDQAIADGLARLGQAGGIGQFVAAPRPPPQVDAGPDRDVEGPAALLGQGLCALQDEPKVGAHGDLEPLAGGAGEFAEFALGIIIAHDVVKLLDAPEGRLGCPAGAGGVGRVEHDAEGHAHLRPLELKTGQDRGVPRHRGAGRRRQPERRQEPGARPPEAGPMTAPRNRPQKSQ